MDRDISSYQVISFEVEQLLLLYGNMEREEKSFQIEDRRETSIRNAHCQSWTRILYISLSVYADFREKIMNSELGFRNRSNDFVELEERI